MQLKYYASSSVCQSQRFASRRRVLRQDPCCLLTASGA